MLQTFSWLSSMCCTRKKMIKWFHYEPNYSSAHVKTIDFWRQLCRRFFGKIISAHISVSTLFALAPTPSRVWLNMMTFSLNLTKGGMRKRILRFMNVCEDLQQPTRAEQQKKFFSCARFQKMRFLRESLFRLWRKFQRVWDVNVFMWLSWMRQNVR